MQADTVADGNECAGRELAVEAGTVGAAVEYRTGRGGSGPCHRARCQWTMARGAAAVYTCTRMAVVKAGTEWVAVVTGTRLVKWMAL